MNSKLIPNSARLLGFKLAGKPDSRDVLMGPKVGKPGPIIPLPPPP